MDSLLKIQIIKNSKMPSNKWSNPQNHRQTVDMTMFNSAVLTGKINNIVVLDIDFKDNGVLEFQKYISSYGEPNTLTQKSPNDGKHYFFTYTHSNKSLEYLIQNFLTNKSKYRNVGIDIRSNGGYVLNAPSKINNKNYEIINNVSISEMPEKLVYWLLETDKLPNARPSSEKIISVKTRLNVSKLIYDVSEVQYTKILKGLDASYLNEVSKWLIITNISKNLDMYDVWDNWSRTSTKYDEYKNIIIWDSSNGIININYLMTALNLPLIKSHKPLPELHLKANKIVNEMYVSNCISYNEFRNNDSVIVKSCTGTGKTSATAKYSKMYLDENPSLKILSITNLITLGLQHKESFNKEGIFMNNYDSEDLDITTDHIYCCINSLYKIFNQVNDFSNYIVYIDEITTFLECLTHNNLLEANLKNTYNLLIRIIKTCNKIIVSDATINENTFTFLQTQKSNRRVFIINEFQKFKDVEAIRYKDENDFYNKIKDAIAKDEYFLFGSDWNGRITHFYNMLLSENEDKKDKFLLITSDTNFKVANASEQFKDKFVFYSPSITTAVDFSIDEAQDVFIYLSGKSILPSGTFQQTTRTRNIHKLHYYASAVNKKVEYDNMNSLTESYTTFEKTSNNINNICVSITTDDEEVIIENTFYKLYMHNEYLMDCYESDKNTHFDKILKDNGFILSVVGDDATLNADILFDMIEVTKDIEESLCDEYIKNTKDKNLIKNNNDDKFVLLKERIETLQLPNDHIETYKDIVINSRETQQHFNILKVLKSKEFIQHKINEMKDNSYGVKVMSSDLTKINLLNSIMAPHNILTIFDASNINLDIDDNKFKLIKKLFKSTKSKPTNDKEVKVLVASMIRHLSGIVISNTYDSYDKVNKVKKYRFSIDEDILKKHLELDKFRNNRLINYDDAILIHYNLQIKDAPIEDHYDEFLDVGIERT
jgi:hypothetical protein